MNRDVAADPRPPSPGPEPLAPFLDLRAALAVRRLGDGGPDVCRALTETLDACLAGLTARFEGQRLAVVAVGGYGRGEVCLSSDIDVMLLHGGRLPPGAVETILYPLWDARLKVGHAVRTVHEAVGAARDRLETLTALLDARAIAGDARLVDDLLAGLGRLLRGRRIDLDGRLAAAEQARRAREPFQLMEADLKEGRGGLRTLQALHWSRRAHAFAGRPLLPESADGWAAHAVLLATRNALHAVAGRPFDRYAHDLRPGVAVWLGLDHDAAGRRLYAAMRTADRLAAERWGLPLPQPFGGPQGPLDPGEGSETGRGVFGSGVRIFHFGKAAVVDGVWARQTPGSATPPPRVGEGAGGRGSAAPLAIAVRALGRPSGWPVFTPEEAAIIRTAGGPAWDQADRTALLRLLAAGVRGWHVFAALEQLGWVERALPEWRHAVAAPQHAPIHLHPLDVHLWRTVIEMLTITRAGAEEPWCAEVAADLGSLDDALLAALLHDIGKGWPGDHAATGAAAVAAFCRRARFGPAMTGVATSAVRHHLLLPTVATRRDIDDPWVAVQVADQAGDLRTLRILYLLTVADSRATGPSVWNPWKASLVRSLFARAAAELARRMGAVGPPSVDEEVRRSLDALTAGWFDPTSVEEHIRAMPSAYVASFAPAEIIRHVELLTPPPEPDAVALDVQPGTPVATATVVAEDRPGLLSAISGVFALHNVTVLDGRFYTRADGLVIDVFHVEDALGGSLDERRWARVREDMARAVRGRDALPLEDLLREKAHAYRARAATRGAGTDAGSGVRVLVDTGASDSFTVVEVHCSDRIGLLHDIARALFELGLDIRLAKVDTQGRAVVDTFYVRDLDGGPVRDAVRLAAIERDLCMRLSADSR